jgi:hypothetical protein
MEFANQAIGQFVGVRFDEVDQAEGEHGILLE